MMDRTISRPKAAQACAVYVTKRSYGAPGPCENVQELRPTHFNGETPTMCASHRAMAYRGQALTLTRDVPAAKRRRDREYVRA